MRANRISFGTYYESVRLSMACRAEAYVFNYLFIEITAGKNVYLYLTNKISLLFSYIDLNIS